jgi:hypothetical protein
MCLFVYAAHIQRASSRLAAQPPATSAAAAAAPASAAAAAASLSSQIDTGRDVRALGKLSKARDKGRVKAAEKASATSTAHKPQVCKYIDDSSTAVELSMHRQLLPLLQVCHKYCSACITTGISTTGSTTSSTTSSSTIIVIRTVASLA